MNETAGSKRWRQYWAHRSDPIHRSKDAAFLDRYAEELAIICGPVAGKRVIEIGCGSGTLYQRLNFDRADYSGFDFSPAMIRAFRESFPHACVDVASWADVGPSGPVDVVFSNGVLQYVTLREVREHLRRFRASISASGRIVHASIPWRPLRYRYFADELLDRPRPRSLKISIAAVAISLNLKADPIGNWFELRKLRDLGVAEGYEVTVYGSLHYPYRCHIAYRPGRP